VSGPITVGFIAGTGRSGSTLLARMLGQLAGVVCVGEVRQIWRRGFLEDWTCGCGRPFSRCPFWTAVVAEAFGDGVDAAGLARAEHQATRVRRLPRQLLGRRPGDGGGAPVLTDALARLYRAVQSVSGARVIIDSSKNPLYAGLLARVPGLELRMVHLTRDPRGAAYSWSRAKAAADRPTEGGMDVMGAAKSSALWTLWNTAAERGGRHGPYLRVRYEDLVADPDPTVAGIATVLGIDPAPDLVAEGAVELGVSHTVSGNADRLGVGTVVLRPDVAWRQALPRSDAAVVTALTAPRLRHFGYPLVPVRR
jgi:hypothetical protein